MTPLLTLPAIARDLNKKTRLAPGKSGQEVEAAGIEPASRNSSTPASTCVVELFNLTAACPCRPGNTAASPELF